MARSRQIRRQPALDAGVVGPDTTAVTACPWALLELAHFCQEFRTRTGGAAPCPIDPSRSPPRLTPPPEPRWQDLPTRQREELLRHLGRMLADRLAAPGTPAEGRHEPR